MNHVRLGLDHCPQIVNTAQNAAIKIEMDKMEGEQPNRNFEIGSKDHHNHTIS
jgi:hypothetical protein